MFRYFLNCVVPPFHHQLVAVESFRNLNPSFIVANWIDFHRSGKDGFLLIIQSVFSDVLAWDEFIPKKCRYQGVFEGALWSARNCIIRQSHARQRAAQARLGGTWRLFAFNAACADVLKVSQSVLKVVIIRENKICCICESEHSVHLTS